jgi:rare lipoprotein A
MARHNTHTFISVSLLTALAAGAAAAQAPIEYAGRASAAPVQTASVTGTLAGGDDNSYGYGAPAPTRGAAVIDVRRSDRARTNVESVRETAPPDQTRAAPTQTTDWLERERVGPPYEANGRWYVPTPEPGYSETGVASWYGPTFHGQATASGEAFDQEAMTAAHPTLPIPSLVQVTNLENGREVIVRVNDRGPFVGERLIDMSRRSAEVLGFEEAGQARVHVRYLGPAPRRVDGASAMAPTAPARQTAVVAREAGPTSLIPAETEEPALAGAPLYEPPARQAPAFAHSAEGAFYAQVGAFSDLTNAHRIRDAVSSAGPVTVDVRRTASGGEVFRVRVGPWNSREEADSARRQLVSLGYGETIVAAR